MIEVLNREFCVLPERILPARIFSALKTLTPADSLVRRGKDDELTMHLFMFLSA
jgi:hypothetical protein